MVAVADMESYVFNLSSCTVFLSATTASQLFETDIRMCGLCWKCLVDTMCGASAYLGRYKNNSYTVW